MSTDETTATDAPAADTVPAPPPAPPAKDGVAADDPEPSPTSAAATVTSGDANPAAAANDGEDGFGAEAVLAVVGGCGWVGVARCYRGGGRCRRWFRIIGSNAVLGRRGWWRSWNRVRRRCVGCSCLIRRHDDMCFFQ